MEGVVEERGRDWFAGVAWASQTHHVFVIDAQGRKLGERGVAHGGEGLADMAAWIGKQTGAAPDAVSVAIKVPRGPVVECLMERGFRVHAIHLQQLDRFRDRFSPAGAKDDSRDVHVLADALRMGPASPPSSCRRSCGRRPSGVSPSLIPRSSVRVENGVAGKPVQGSPCHPDDAVRAPSGRRFAGP